MTSLSSHWSKYKSVWITIFALFITTRIILTFIAGLSHTFLEEQNTQTWKQNGDIADHSYIKLWSVWDSNWYLKIAQNGYSDSYSFDPSKYASVGFFPLYPLLVFICGAIIGSNVVGGFVLSNLFLLISAFLIYKLARENYDEETSKRSIWYLFLFPSAYIFSSIYPESLLLMLWLMTVLAAKRKRWLIAGCFGFLAAATKPLGFLILLPAMLIYIQKKGGLKQVRADVVYLALIPLGIAAVGFVHYLVTGDLFAYSHIQSLAWHHSLSNPLISIYKSLLSGPVSVFNAGSTVLFLTLLITGWKQVPREYLFFGLAVVLFIPLNGYIIGVWRYAASVFPLILILASWGRSAIPHQIILTTMALLQAGLFIFWTLGFWFMS
jgi:hypothetical protein